MKTTTERRAAIHCALTIANEAMKRNEKVLTELRRLTKNN